MKTNLESPVWIEVVRPGAFTTVQDLGRKGHQGIGVTEGGAMDRQAARVANLLVGNDPALAVLETTMAGPVLAFSTDTLVAVCGARFKGVPHWQTFVLRSGGILDLSGLEQGWRGYVAVSGGFSVPLKMGSASTHLRGAFGGLEGRLLRRADRIAVGASAPGIPVGLEHWHVSPEIIPPYSPEPVVRVLGGAQEEWFTQTTRERFYNTPYAVLPDSDRMGLRLDGLALPLETQRAMVSEPVTWGSVQVPVGGQPIVLMADRQTMGGYPRIAEVITVDLPLLAQLRPGDRVRFVKTTIAEAHRLLIASEHALGVLREGLAGKLP